MNERHSYLAQSKKRTILAFAFLFVFSPIFPALARESASRDMVPSSKPSIEREMKTEPVKKSEPPASLKNAETARDTETKSDPKPDPDPPKFGTDPDTKSDDGHDGEPSKEDPAVARLTAVNPAALSTNLTPSTIKQLLPTADASTGALTYSYPFTLPPGRAGMAPDLRLSYNNQSSQDVSFVGHGWSLSVPFIERLNKMGTNGIYTSDYFSSSIGGELSPIGSGLYAPKVEDGSFVEYELFGNVWTLRDKEGTIYTYGATVDERQDNPADASQVFTWMLSEIRDRNDNFVSFAYDKDAGAIYPSSIVYTGHGSVDGIFEVVFVREARPDPSTSYRTAFGVTTNDRLSLIDVYADGDLVRSYDLGYASGDNGTRSVLTSITETGYDDTSAPVSLLPVEIEYQTTAPGWSTNATWEAPVGFAPQNSACNNLGSRVADVNGDGLPDVLQSRMDSAGNTWQSVYINNGSGWTLDPSWVIPRAFGYTSWCSGDFGSEVVDVNGDALADIIHYRIFSNSSAFEHEVYLNTGSGWVQNFTWTIPRAFRLEWSDWGTRLADVNGDGLTDFVWSKGNDRGVALNTGSNWVVDPSWSVPIIFTFDSLFVRGTEVADVNGDGLADIIEANTGSSGFQQAVYLNTGSGWTLDLSWIFPAPLRINNFADYGTRLADMNGDGLLDVLVGYATSNNFFEAYMNTGSGWVSAPSWLPLPSVFAAGGFGSDTGVRLVDVDGNGMMDFVKSLDTGSSLFPLITDTWLANGLRADRATTFVSPSGGTTSVEYQTPQEMTDGPILLNPETPFVFDVVSEIERDNGFGTVSTHDYLYEGGVYDFSTLLDRKFAGFHIRTETDAEGNQVRDYFHQGNATDAALGELSDHVSKAGRAYRTEVLNVAGDLVQAAVNGWDRADLGDGRSFVKLTQSLALGYDGNATHRDRATAYVYNNANGNVTQMVEWGEVSGNSNGTFSDVGSDKRTTTVSYASNPTYHILGLPSQVTVTDFSGALVSDAKAYYDGLPLESVNIGNETLEERWVDGSEYVSTQKAYNAYGFVIAQWDELGRMTEFLPDANNLFVARATNPLGHQTWIEYDADSGLVIQTTDPNGRINETVYDGLNRSIEEWQSSADSPLPLELSAAYAYAPQSPGLQMLTTEYFDAASSRETYAYTDGFDRPMQERVETETPGEFAASDTIYDTREFIASRSLPYFSSGIARTPAVSDAALLSTFTYDALGRTVNIATAVGNTATSYDQWSSAVTDLRGVSKEFERDAFDRLVSVFEHNGSSSYTTTYAYNGRGDLTNLTDALGNTRAFTYDGLSRRLTAQDLHASGDTTFGTWMYVYDAGNLVLRTDPRGEAVELVYDELNRLIIENPLSNPGTGASYTYDFCSNGIGLPCEAGSPTASETNGYDLLGRRTFLARFIDGDPSVAAFVYDRAGRVTETTYPDGSQVQNVYDVSGYLESINRKESISSVFTPVVVSIAYAPTFKRAVVSYANGVTATNVYDDVELYRLRSRTAIGPSGTLQHLTYAYDPNGNVVQIADASSTSTAKMTDYVYDDLNRLLSSTVTGSANGDDSVQTFSYNALGNLLTRSDVGTYLYEGHLGVSYANPHAATSVGGAEVSYDESGNVVSVEDSTSYTWDYDNRLIGMSPLAASSMPVSSFFYDADGARVKSVTDGNVSVFPMNGYRTEGDTIHKELFFDDAEAAATVEGTGAGATVRFVHTDHLTGSAVVTDAAGAVAQLLDYHPFGTQRINEQTSLYDVKRKFAGHEYDTETGLSYMLARYYDPATGRFLSEDPAFLAIGDHGVFESRFGRSLEAFLSDPQLLNSYSYARNNPLTLLDPTGAAPAIPATQYLPSFGSMLFRNNFNVGMTLLQYGLMYSTAKDIETVTDNQQSTASRVIAGVSLGAMVAGGMGEGVGATAKVVQGGRATVGAVGDIASGSRGLGQTFGVLGRVIENPGMKVLGYTKHGLQQKITRGVSSQLVKDTVDHASVVLQQSGNTFLHLTDKAGVVLNGLGRVVTTYGSNLFKSEVQNVLRSIK